MFKPSRTWIFALAGVLVLAGVVVFFAQDAQKARETTPAAALVHTFDKSPTGFTFDYPASWDYMIPMQGVLTTGMPETLYDNQPGPTLTVQRSLPISIPGTLDNAINKYLESGPQRIDGLWNITAPVSVTTFDGRDARMVELEGSAAAAAPLTHVRVIATMANNTFVYLIITTVPVELRHEFDPTLEAVLATVHILE